ncbi:hypothetical protein D046_0527B, partial [Vibrio parahaemolyticus V-223/04]
LVVQKTAPTQLAHRDVPLHRDIDTS